MNFKHTTFELFDKMKANKDLFGEVEGCFMTYFDTMVKNMGNKDLNAIKEWIHPDYIFVADFEMLTKDDWLNATEKNFRDGTVTLHNNAKCLLENEHLVVFEQTFVREGELILSINTTHFRDGKPWRTIINRVPIEE